MTPTTPALLAQTRRQTGLPDILIVSRKDLTADSLKRLAQTGARLGFAIEHPESGFAGGIHHVKALTRALDTVRWTDGAADVDWLAGDNLGRLSRISARKVAFAAQCSPSRFTRDYFRGPRPSFRCEVPEQWAREVVGLYGQPSLEEFKAHAAMFFPDD